MADNQITPFQLTDQFTMDNFNQRINETNTSLQNKAPAGYGLGGMPKLLTANDDLNSIGASGWYIWFDQVPAHAPTRYCTMRVDGGYSGILWAKQTIYYSSGEPNCCVLIRSCITGGTVWEEEWENPPMSVGVEYRTTERYMGRPLYVKMVSGGEYVQNARFSFGSSNVDNVIKFYGKIGAYCNPIINENNLSYDYTNYLKVHYENGDIVVDMLGGTKSYGEVTVIAYYTKSTD